MEDTNFVIRYEIEHDSTGRKAERAIAHEEQLGFYWIEDLVTLTGVYENSREQYPTFSSFLPIIEAYFNDLATNMEFKYRRYAKKFLKF